MDDTHKTSMRVLTSLTRQIRSADAAVNKGSEGGGKKASRKYVTVLRVTHWCGDGLHSSCGSFARCTLLSISSCLALSCLVLSRPEA